MDIRECIAFLTGSDGRIAVLGALANEPHRPCELRERTEPSRTAIHRALSGFQEYGWVHKCDEQYALTAAGRHVAEQYETLAAVVERSDRFSDFLAVFPHADDLPFPFEGEVTVATPTEPQAAETFFFENMPEDIDRFRGFTPVITHCLVKSFEPTVEAGTAVELVYDESVTQRLQEAYPETMDVALQSDLVTIHVVRRPLEGGLALVDGNVFLKAYGSHGNLKACLHSTDDRLLAWAKNWFERSITGAVPLSEYARGVDTA